MLMTEKSHHGKNADGSLSEDYCCYCYDEGAFFYPDATMEQVIESCLPHVVPDVWPDEASARAAMNEHFPTLKCWKKTGMIISFKLKEGVSEQEFLAASDKIQESYLAGCKGFIARQLMTIGSVWTDWVIWETLVDGENAARKSVEEQSAIEFNSFIAEVVEHGLYPLERVY